jgi:DNA-binding SARP family transcriptional activator
VLEPERPGHAPSGLLAWTEVGYQLTLPKRALDLDVFEGGPSRARAARAAGQLREAAEALHSALGLWRGPVCDGLSSPFLDAQADRLDESRISVLEERIELDLAIGVHADLIAELRDLVARHPLRERLYGLLMLALYRVGRQADALPCSGTLDAICTMNSASSPGPRFSNCISRSWPLIRSWRQRLPMRSSVRSGQ